MICVADALFQYREPDYADFQRKLLPTVEPNRIIGVRAPMLRKLTKAWSREACFDSFMKSLPHSYYEESCVHGYRINLYQDFDEAVSALEKFLPFVDNWGVCDLIRPRVFAEHREEILPILRRWMQSDHPFTVRFAMEMLMVHFLEEDFCPDYLQWVADIDSNNYYVNMMAAWYFSTALACQYDCALPYLKDGYLSAWVHNKTIQKAVESYRISPQQKTELKALRILAARGKQRESMENLAAL